MVNFEFAIANANRLKPAFVVITGDLINQFSNAAQAAEYKRITAKLVACLSRTGSGLRSH